MRADTRGRANEGPTNPRYSSCSPPVDELKCHSITTRRMRITNFRVIFDRLRGDGIIYLLEKAHLTRSVLIFG